MNVSMRIDQLCFRISVNFLTQICVLSPGWNSSCNRNKISARRAKRNFSPGWNSPCNQPLTVGYYGLCTCFSIIISLLIKWKWVCFILTVPQEGPGYQFSHDVFVSYSAKDDEWVKDNLQPLFDGSNIKYIIHSRDFIPGKAFFDNMAANRVYSSRKVILVMSKNYLSSGFCKDEMQMALFRAARNDENGYLIVVKIDGVKPQDIPKSLRHQTFIDYTSKEEETTWKKKILEFVSSGNRSLSVSANGGLVSTSDTISLILNEFELKRKKNQNVSRETNDQADCKSLL